MIDNPQILMLEAIRIVERINYVSSRILIADTRVFGNISLQIPNFNPPELGFIRTVSWLYVLYYEAGKINVDFLSDLFSAFALDPQGDIKQHHLIVQRLRTFLQHNLDINKPRDRDIQKHCEEWFQKQCQTLLPEDDEHWKTCLSSILEEAVSFLGILKECLRKIEQDDSRDQIINQWNFRITRYHPAHEFDQLISIVASDMGRDSIDATRLRQRFYDKWVRELSLLQDKYDFEIEARKLIENVLLIEITPVLPLTGKDIIEEFKIEPGPQVGSLLTKARALYDQDPCSQSELLDKLRPYL